MKNTTLALATKPNLIPKPTKSEIIEAMVARAVGKIEAENEVNSKKREALRVKIEKLGQKLAKSQKFRVYIFADSNKPHVDLGCSEVTSPEMDKLLADYKACPNVRIDEKKLREQIRHEVNGTLKPDPNRLLNNPDTVKAIDAQLAAWGIQ
jgi:hypothetical protein